MKRARVIAHADKISAQRPSITVTGLLGNRREILIGDRTLLIGIKRGDRVDFEHTETLAISAAPKKEARRWE